jgi:hypothetical protein
MKFRKTLTWLSGLALAASTLSVCFAQGQNGGKIVCWKDAAGKVIGCGDKVPVEFLDRGTKVLDKQGIVRKTGESAEETAKREAREKELALVREDEKKRAIARKRQDEALLNTFSNEKEIDLKRDRELQALSLFITQQKAALQGANERYADVRKRADTFEKSKKPLPPVVKEDLARAEREKTRIETDIAEKEKAKVDISAEYAEYRNRFAELKGTRPASTPEVLPAATTTAAATVKK